MSFFQKVEKVAKRASDIMSGCTDDCDTGGPISGCHHDFLDPNSKTLDESIKRTQ